MPKPKPETTVTDLTPHHADSLANPEAGVMASMTKAAEQLRAMLVVAHAKPRDEARAMVRLNRSLARPGFAEDVTYRFPRGGKEIVGPSVYLAREFARCFGNFHSGVDIISIGEEDVQIEGFCLDLETNYRVSLQARFKKLIQRKRNGKTVWEVPDERDLRELINRHGAIAQRNAILQCIPPDLVDMAVETAGETLRGSVKEEDYENCVKFFDKEFSVPLEELEAYLGVRKPEWGPQHILKLRQVTRSLKDGFSRVGEFFFKGSKEGVEEADAPDMSQVESEADLDKADGDLFSQEGGNA